MKTYTRYLQEAAASQNRASAKYSRGDRDRDTGQREHFWAKVNRAGPIPDYRPELGNCWLWTDTPNDDGYGLFYIRGKSIRAHRYALQEHLGRSLQEGMVPDHLCRVRLCVRPSHLEEVTPQENHRRGLKGRFGNPLAPSSCPKGHQYTDVTRVKTVRGDLRCLICERDSNRARSKRWLLGTKRLASNATSNSGGDRQEKEATGQSERSSAPAKHTPASPSITANTLALAYAGFLLAPMFLLALLLWGAI